MDNTGTKEALKQAADQHQPLLFTHGQDLSSLIKRNLGWAFLFAITCSSVLSVLLIFIFVFKESLPFLTGGFLTQFLTSTAWDPTDTSPEFGALACIAGSIYVTFGSLIIAVPVGIVVAVFLSDIAPFGVRNIIKPVIEILAAIPSVAYGFFAALILAPILQKWFGFSTGTNALTASLILAVMALPTIISVAEDSLFAIGRELREASYAMGATRFETIFKVIIPASYSGIVAAVILGMMRAIGETMVVLMASGNASQIPHPWWDLSQSVRTLTATIALEMGETPKETSHYHALFAIGVLLLIFTFMLNLTSEYFLSRAKRKTWGKSK